MPETDLIQESFKINIQVLKYVGLYRSRAFPNLSKIYGMFLYIIFNVGVVILGYTQWIKFPNEMIGNLTAPHLIQATFFLIKFFPFLSDNKKVQNCMNFLADPYFVPEEKNQKKILTNCVRYCQRLNLFYFSEVVCLVIVGVSLPVFMEKQDFPISIWLPYDTKQNFWTFYLTYGIISLEIVYISLNGTMIDPLLGGLIYHITCQLKVLKYNLENINSAADFPDVYRLVEECAEHYNIILRYVNTVQECFSLSIFSQFASTVASTGMIILQIILVPSDGLVLLSFLSIFAVLFQFFFYCYYGQLLFEENKTINDSIYLSKWYDYDILTQKALLIIMERAKKPMIIRAGKVTGLTLETFKKMLQTIYSLVALLNQIY